MAEQEVGTAGSFLDTFVEYLKRALEIVQLKGEEIDRIKGDEEAFTVGLVIIALSGVASAIGSMAPFGVVILPIFYLIGAFIGSGILHLIATVAFKGEGEFLDFFRPFSFAYILTWVSVVWVLNFVLTPLAAVWMCVVWVVCVERVYGLDRPKAIATVAVPVVVLTVLFMMFFAAVLSMAVLMGTLAS
jgi:hypothetical protein